MTFGDEAKQLPIVEAVPHSNWVLSRMLIGEQHLATGKKHGGSEGSQQENIIISGACLARSSFGAPPHGQAARSPQTRALLKPQPSCLLSTGAAHHPVLHMHRSESLCKWKIRPIILSQLIPCLPCPRRRNTDAKMQNFHLTGALPLSLFPTCHEADRVSRSLM